MAIIENGYLRGQIGNVVNRKVGDKNIVQTKPSDKTRQTRWTEAAASDFGTASSAGAIIRRAFRAVHQGIHDREMHNRLVKRMQRVLRGYGTHEQGYLSVRDGNIQRLVDFQFNKNSHIYDFVYLDPEVTFAKNGNTTIKLPKISAQQNLNWPKGCSHIIIKIDIIGISFQKGYGKSFGSYEIEMQRFSSEQQAVEPQTLNFEIDDTMYNSIIVSLSTLYLDKYKNYATLLNSEKLNPAGIIAAYNI